MRFPTQHIRVNNGHANYQLHRDGNVTWETVDGKGNETGISNVITHTSIAEAKALFGSITSVSR